MISRHVRRFDQLQDRVVLVHRHVVIATFQLDHSGAVVVVCCDLLNCLFVDLRQMNDVYRELNKPDAVMIDDIEFHEQCKLSVFTNQAQCTSHQSK